MTNELPDEHSVDSPPMDAGLPILKLPSGWTEIYNYLREAHVAALTAARHNPTDVEAQDVRRAATAAVQAFRKVYQESSTRGIVSQINDL